MALYTREHYRKCSWIGPTTVASQKPVVGRQGGEVIEREVVMKDTMGGCRLRRSRSRGTEVASHRRRRNRGRGGRGARACPRCYGRPLRRLLCQRAGTPTFNRTGPQTPFFRMPHHDQLFGKSGLQSDTVRVVQWSGNSRSPRSSATPARLARPRLGLHDWEREIV